MVMSTDIINKTMKKSNKYKEILRFPRLDTILMVEDFLQKHKQGIGKKRLWMSLPKKMMYQTFCLIIDYLLYSGKITIRDKKIVWMQKLLISDKAKNKIKNKTLFFDNVK